MTRSSRAGIGPGVSCGCLPSGSADPSCTVHSDAGFLRRCYVLDLSGDGEHSAERSEAADASATSLSLFRLVRVMSHYIRLLSAVAAGCFCLSVSAQQPPGPGPEHEKLMKLVGTWDCMMHMEGAPASKCVCVYKKALGGMWLESTFEGSVAGMDFTGRGFDSYDAGSKKYKSIWLDSTVGFPSVFTGDYNDKGELVMTGEMGNPEGGTINVKAVTTHQDDDHFSFRMLMIAGDQEVEMFHIDYVRRK